MVITILMTLVAACLSAAAQAANVSVISGNQVDVGGMLIRLWGIQPPEAEAMCRRGDMGDVCAVTSRRVLERLIGKEELRCLVMASQPGEPVVAKCAVYGKDLGQLMVLSGWATDHSPESSGHYAFEEEVARGERVGMWKYR